MDITNKKLADIIPYAKNAKKHNKVQINNVAEASGNMVLYNR